MTGRLQIHDGRPFQRSVEGANLVFVRQEQATESDAVFSDARRGESGAAGFLSVLCEALAR